MNHVRTLLLNTPASAATPMGEYVPPLFRPVAVPRYLQQARGLLFGARPDAMMLDYRLRQYMAMLHATELAEFVTAQDPRITYTPGGRDMADFDFAPSATPIGHAYPLFISGDRPVAIDGRMTCSWQVAIKAVSSLTTVAVTRRSPTPGYAEYGIAFPAGLSDEFPLDGSPLLGRFQANPGIVAGTTWIVSCLAPPARDPGQVAADFDAVGGDILGGLFGGAVVEPYATWSNLWYSAQPLPYRLGAVLLATAARTDAVRMGAR